MHVEFPAVGTDGTLTQVLPLVVSQSSNYDWFVVLQKVRK